MAQVDGQSLCLCLCRLRFAWRVVAKVIVAAAAALLYPASLLLPPALPACLAKSSAEQAGSGQASPVGGQATTCNANGVHRDRYCCLPAFLFPYAGLRFNDTRDKQQQGLPQQQQQQQQRLQQQHRRHKQHKTHSM